MTAVQEAVTEAPAVEAVPKRSMTLGYGTSLAMLALLIVVPLSLVGVALAPFAIPLLFGDPFRPAVPMTQILFVGTFASTISVILSGGLLSTGRPALPAIVMTAGAVLTVPALFLLVPRWGGVGAAVATTTTYVVVGVLTAVIFARVARLPLRQCWFPDRADVDAVMVGARRLTSRRPASERNHEGA